MCLFVSAIPAPNGTIIANANQNVAITRECGLANRLRAFWMCQHYSTDWCWIGCVDIPKKYLPRLVAQGHKFTMMVQRKTNEPNFTIFILKAMQNRCRRITMLEFIGVVIQAAGLPANDRVWFAWLKHEIETMICISIWGSHWTFPKKSMHLPLTSQNHRSNAHSQLKRRE